jgi:GT2 family glycosyltransferase
MKITAYVTCHNSEQTLPEVLAALKGQSRPADQYLFVHDRCTDQSQVIGETHGFEMIAQSGPRGLAAGRNHALRAATGDVILGIDADVVVAPNYLEELEKLFNAHPEVTGIGGRLDERYTDTPADLWRSVHMPQHLGSQEQLDPRLITGATAAYRVSILRQFSGWNERFVSNFEDVDLCDRLRASGFHLLYSPACRAQHLRRDTLQSVLKTFWAWNFYGYEESLKSLDRWLESRLQSIWWRHRLARMDDVRHPSLCPITLLMPWVWILRDLDMLRKNAGDIGQIGALATIAGNILIRLGMKPQNVIAMTQHIEKLAAELDAGHASPQPLSPQIARQVAVAALENIPDASYWQICNAGMEQSSDFHLARRDKK